MGRRGLLRTLKGGRLGFICPGCEMLHALPIGEGPGPRWGFNGDYDRPTFTPSILARWPWGDPPVERVCHSFVTDGQIQFLTDCTHQLAGQTVPLPAEDHLDGELE